MDIKKDKEVNGKVSYEQNGFKQTKVFTKSAPSLVSRFFLCWMLPILYKGISKDLEESDLRPAQHQYDSKRVGNLLEKNWLKEESITKSAGGVPSLMKILVQTYWLSYIPGGIMQFLANAIRTFNPLLFAKLLKFWTVPEDPAQAMSKQTAAVYAGSLVLANLLAAFLNHHGNLFCQQYGMKVRIAVSSLLFRKILRMNTSVLVDTAAGKMVNILTNDMQRIELALLFLHYTWIIPLQLAAVSYLGYMQAGSAALIGLAVLVVIVFPIQVGIGRTLGKLRSRTAEKTDQRINVMNEFMNGIQVIKMYTWELPFQKVVSEKRDEEMKYVKLASFLRFTVTGMMYFTERLALFIIILVFILSGNAMTANVIYPLQQFMNAAQVNITLVLPLILTFTTEAIVSIKRMQNFLTSEDQLNSEKNSKSIHKLSLVKSTRKSSEMFAEIEMNDGSYNPELAHPHPPQNLALELHNVSVSWTGDTANCVLKNISFQLSQGKLCVIIGPVGSGKSALLQLLLKELRPHSGSVFVQGSVSYASQDAWLFPSTVRENILFGLPFLSKKYKQVCRVCCLEEDFKQFPYADQSLVGEKGVILSGGQRARVNLARALYREADIYLMDDPLSAVDAKVGRHLFEGCINGYLRGRTRLLVTHQIHFLKDADYILVLDQGQITYMGTYDELANTEEEFSKLLASLQEGKNKDVQGVESKDNEDKKENKAEDTVKLEAQKVQKENQQSGSLKWSVIASYLNSGGNKWFIAFNILMILLTTISAASVDYWLSFWTNNMSKYGQSSKNETSELPRNSLNDYVGLYTTKQYLTIYGCLVLSTIIIVHIFIFNFVRLIVTASKNLHNFMFCTVIKGVMRFFDTSYSGRVLNRFTKDVGSLDEILPRLLISVLQMYSTLFTVLVLNAIALYWTIIPSLFLLLVFALIVRLQKRTAQSIMRLEATAKSPVLGMVTSAFNGIVTIRSAGAQKRLIDEFDRHQDTHTTARNGVLCGTSTFSFYLNVLCVLYLTMVVFIFIYFDVGSLVGVGSVGLAVTQTITLTSMLQHAARVIVECFAQFTSVERVLEYTRIDTEKDLFEGKTKAPALWPSEGRIILSGVSMRYAPEEAPVLKDLNVNVESGWKVGIVGRTGAGKSSLISALFRFAYLEGKITIDGIDTSLVSKQELRSKISIIPQEPVLFSATIRYNLDPFNVYSDSDIWRALEQVEMKNAVPSLDFKVTEGGSNFSVGQRQLLCLARAMLRSNKILIMDEATANVDTETDNFIQKTIRHHFASCTVLTIAHRLNTIMDSDRVLVMSFGQAVEYDHPYVLLRDPNSHFSAMVRETGEKTAAKLLQVAKEAYSHSNPVTKF